jgi:UDPglucose 6-dehydrogenase
MDAARTMIDGLEVGDSAYQVADGADALVLITEWNQFRALDLERLKAAMAGPVFVDLRNVYRPDEMAAEGFHYVSVGRPDVGIDTDD